MNFVLDASVTMRWFFEAGKHSRADAVLQCLVSGADTAAVPLLWRYEVSAVLVRAQQRDNLPTQEAVNFIENLEGLPIFIDDESARRVFTDVHRLAARYRLTTYDAAYLELALRRGLAIATLDAELIAASKSAGLAVI